MSALIDAILARAGQIPNRVALRDGANDVAYGALPGEIDAMAGMIADEIGAGSGPVGIALDNGLNWILADLALLQLGRACVPLPPFFTPEQAASALADAGACAVIGRNGIERLDGGPAPLPAGTAKISYTSGSTGTPKGICLSQSAMLATAGAIVDRLGAERAGVHMPLLPLGVLLENVGGLYATLLAGGCYLGLSLEQAGMARMFDPRADMIIADIRQAGVTSLILVPELLGRIVADMESTGTTLPSLDLIAVGGAHVAPALLDRAAQLGLPVVQGYGLTECGSVVTLDAPDDHRAGTVGRPLSHIALSISEDGEIMIAGSGHLGTVGHARMPGPIATGDLGVLDDDGRVRLLGRKSNLIITSFGRNISPEWVEAVLTGQPAIAQALVEGDGHRALRALIVPASSTANVGEAIAQANAALPEYARIERWRLGRPFTPLDGTLTGNGRLRRPEILAREAALPFFDRLAMHSAQARARMMAIPQLQAGIAGRISRDTYLAYLAQAYHHVRHTVPLMRLARGRLQHKPHLIAALDEYIAEEEGHEAWILNDIRAAGGNADLAVSQGPSHATARMVDHAYHAIQTGNAAAFFGMVFVLEGTSTAFASSGAEAVRSSLGLPADAFTYLSSHGALDQDHMRFFETLVNALDDRDDEQAILTMADAMFDLFGGLFAAIPMENDIAA
ncbi:AMP-binding protein [Rhizorhabdus sp.]|uniref:AMP-binding protein n=1 Tax=Rhizorhabdus sp. TaxID=1968843 RepID=UPI0025CF500A|nr:AMP-binding protein [Rhizorhabdus sp.]